MPLPAALLERLKKRGIVAPKVEEEVIAEDHDSDTSESSDDSREDAGTEAASCSRRSYKTIQTVLGCPNKVNLYHDCTEYCQEKYGNGKEVPSPKTERKYRRLLKRFPLPLDWLDVWEPGTARYYFWNTETDQVSWLPPLHPKAKISIPVSEMRQTMRPEIREGSQSGSSDDSDEEDSDESDSESEEEEPAAKKPTLPDRFNEPRKAFQDKRPFRDERQPVRRNDLDPMDPASYSDSCPRGKWSDGLSASRDE